MSFGLNVFYQNVYKISIKFYKQKVEYLIQENETVQYVIVNRL